MKPFIIAFLGNKTVRNRQAVLKNLVFYLQDQFVQEEDYLQTTEPIFYCGGYGEFSQIAAEAIDVVRERNSAFRSKKLFITPYITPSYMKKIEFIKDAYDEIVYPPLESVPPQFAISRRNKWMIDECDILIVYIEYSCGNTRKYVEYAIRKDKFIIRVSEGGLRQLTETI